jgi:hypothetical protein
MTGMSSTTVHLRFVLVGRTIIRSFTWAVQTTADTVSNNARRRQLRTTIPYWPCLHGHRAGRQAEHKKKKSNSNAEQKLEQTHDERAEVWYELASVGM